MDWHIIAIGMMIVAAISATQALLGDPERARDRWLQAIFFKLSAIFSILLFISKQGG